MGWVNLRVGLGWVGSGRNFPPFGELGRVVGLIWQVAKTKVFYLLSVWSVVKLLAENSSNKILA